LDFFFGFTMREIVHMQAGQCGNQIGAKVGSNSCQPTVRRFSCFEALARFLLPDNPSQFI
jgi:hypothetical protein